MFHKRRSYNGMVVAPHHFAAEAGSRVLRDGGNAIEAMIAAASTIAVVYPHMNSLGGDNFWLLDTPGGPPVGIDACGASAASATPDYYRSKGLTSIPGRGPDAALTVAGAVSGWQMALQYSVQQGGKMPLSRLFEDAIHHARTGVPASATLAANAAAKLPELVEQPGFSDTYVTSGQPVQTGALHLQPAIATTLEHLAKNGLDDFYRGALAESMARELEAAGSP